MPTYSCGCVNAEDPASGAEFCVHKCEFHVSWLADQPKGDAYYRSIGVLNPDGSVARDRYVAELEDALGELPLPPGLANDEALEIGCGVSPYVRAVQTRGYAYTGIDPDQWAATRTSLEGLPGSSVNVIAGPFRGADWGDRFFSLVLVAHSLEHLPDAPGALRDVFRMLVPGGHLVLLIPDDEDKVNPDHTWFFSEPALRAYLAKTGFEVVRAAVRRMNDRENFLYFLARKPAR